MVLDDKTYKVAKYVTNIVLPAIATLYLAISGVLVRVDFLVYLILMLWLVLLLL